MSKLGFVVLAGSLAGCGAVSGVNSGLDDPTITAVTPDHGPSIGGVTVTLTGTGLNAGMPIVVIDGIAASSATAVSDTSVTFMLPPGAEGHIVDITLTNDKGFGTAAHSFTYNVLPVILSITPAGGRAAGGTNITMTGRGFQALEAGVPTITIAGGVATNVQIVSDSMLTATTGPSTAGSPVFTPVDVQLANANGPAVLQKSFTETAHGLLANDRGNNSMIWIDLAKGTSIELARFQRQVGACALSPSGQLFGFAFNQSDGQRELVTFDPLTGVVTTIAKLADSTAGIHSATSMTFVGNTLFATDTAVNRGGTISSRLITIDPASGLVTVVSAAGSALPRPNAITGKNGTTLLFANQGNQTLNTIDTGTGVMTPGTALSGGRPNRVHGLTTVGGTTYLADKAFPSAVYTLNTATAALTLLANVPAQIQALCETPPSF